MAALKRSRDYDPGHIYDLWKRTIRQAASTGAAGAGPAGKGRADALPAADPASGDQPTRVLLVSESLWGGAGRVISWLASRLAAGGHAVQLVLRTREGHACEPPDAR